MFCKNCGQQVKIGNKFCTDCGQEIKYGKFFILKFKTIEWIKNHQKLLLVSFLMIAFFLAFISIYGELSNSKIDTKSNSTKEVIPNNLYSQDKIISSVVNILCPYSNQEFNLDSQGEGGSGTILDEDGLIITNSHIIPQDEDYLDITEHGCFVILPDKLTGSPKEIYLANPVVIPGLSDEYDLAYLEIYDVYTDEDGSTYGVYPNKFPVFKGNDYCQEEYVRLGEEVRIFGYPSYSGGTSLTITEGVVSSFPGDGLIMTSAKIDAGNSGGLAIDKNGCMLGIPSSVSKGDYESLGIIISMDLINKFAEEIDKITE